MGSAGDFSNANTGPLPLRDLKSKKFRPASSSDEYDSVNRLARLALLSAAASAGNPIVSQQGNSGVM